MLIVFVLVWTPHSSLRALLLEERSTGEDLLHESWEGLESDSCLHALRFPGARAACDDDERGEVVTTAAVGVASAAIEMGSR